MIQVPPTGPPPSRPASKAPPQDPAETGFPAMALLAASAPVQANSQDSADPVAGPREASDSQPEKESAAADTAPPAAKPVEAGAPPPGSPPSSLSALAIPPEVNPLALVSASPAEVRSAPTIQSAAASPVPIPAVAAGAMPVAAELASLAKAPIEAPTTQAPTTQASTTQAPTSQAPAVGEGAAPPGSPRTAPPVDGPAPDPARSRVPQPTGGDAPAAPARPSMGLEPGNGAPKDPVEMTGIPRHPAELEPGTVFRTRPRGPSPAVDPLAKSTAAAVESAGPSSPTQPPQAVPPGAAALAPPLVPGRSSQSDSAPKENSRPAESRPAAENPSPRAADAPAATAEPDATRPTPAPREAALELPRSESLGLQPTQVPATGPNGHPSTVASSRSDAPTGQAPLPATLQQVESGIRWMLRNSAPGAELQLHPEALGRIRIELKVEGGEVHARLWASDPKSIPVLQESKPFLEVSLREQGLNLGSFDLRQHSHQPQPQHPEGQSRGQSWPTEARAFEQGQDAPTRPAPIVLNARRIELIA